MKEFIDNLKRDKARGELAPHQIILLISLNKLYLKNKSKIIEIGDLLDAFSLTWKEHQHSFKTKNCNLGMPLKVFLNKDYIEIDIKEDIKDFRSKTELRSKITEIRISQTLLNILIKVEFNDYIKTRINF